MSLITEKLMIQRVELGEKMMELFNVLMLLFSDAHFWFDGYVNKQNLCFWGKENLRIYEAKSLHII